MPQLNEREAPELPAAVDAQTVVKAFGALPDQDTPGAVGQAVRNLAPAEQRAAVLAAANTLPTAATPDLVRTMVGNADPATGREAVTAGLNALSPADREAAAASVLGAPDARTQRTLWLLVVGTMAGAVFVFGALTVVLLVLGKTADAPLALATTALGGIVGLVVTSPVSVRQGSR